MAKRQDELAAYTFARKRTVAAFLAPSPGGSEEGAPRPIRTVMPSLAVGVALVVGFIGWGVIKPTAPEGWDKPGEYIIVDSDSTTRYVVLPDEASNGKKTPTLHPVLNYASAKLLLDKGKGSVLEVPGKEIDKSGIPHGATLGIPYAPDRLPSKDDASKTKTWAVCERPAPGSDDAIDRAVFVLDADDAKSLGDAGKVNGREALYVVDRKTSLEYLVDGKGNRFLLGGKSGLDDTTMAQLLRSAVIGSNAEPQPVSQEWLRTLNDGGVIAFPAVPSAGQPTTVQGLPADANKVGQVLEAQDAGASSTTSSSRTRSPPSRPSSPNCSSGRPPPWGPMPSRSPPRTSSRPTAARRTASTRTRAGPRAFRSRPTPRPRGPTRPVPPRAASTTAPSARTRNRSSPPGPERRTPRRSSPIR